MGAFLRKKGSFFQTIGEDYGLPSSRFYQVEQGDFTFLWNYYFHASRYFPYIQPSAEQ